MSETTLTSPQNAVFKKQQKTLRDARFRRSEGVLWIEGERAVRDLDPASIEALMIGPDVGAGDWPAPPYRLDRELADRAFVTEAPVEVGALVRWSPTGLGDLPPGPWLVLDGLQDPGNTGTLVRSAAALGAAAVVICHGADPTNPKAVRASAGALMRIPVAVAGLTEVQEACSDRRVVVARAGHGEADPAGADVLVIGSEAHGPASSWSAEAWSVPLAAGIESLNAAAAGAILLDRAVRR